MPTFLTEPPALVFQAVLLCCVFLTGAPKLTRYAALSYALSLGVEAMAWEGTWARMLHTTFILIAAGLVTTWAYGVTNGQPG